MACEASKESAQANSRVMVIPFVGGVGLPAPNKVGRDTGFEPRLSLQAGVEARQYH